MSATADAALRGAAGFIEELLAAPEGLSDDGLAELAKAKTKLEAGIAGDGDALAEAHEGIVRLRSGLDDDVLVDLLDEIELPCYLALDEIRTADEEARGAYAEFEEDLAGGGLTDPRSPQAAA